MTTFTLRCCHHFKKWHTEFASSCRIFLSLILLSSFFTTTIRAQGPGVAPVDPRPIGGLNIDGFLGRQGAAGDWFAGPGGAGAQTFLFNANGTSQFPQFLNKTLFWKIDAYTLGGTTIGGPEDRFTGGSKLNESPGSWKWDDHSPQSKDDINNAFFFLVLDNINHVAPEVPGNHWWALMAGDRETTEGTSFLDFEFLQHEVNKVAGGTFTTTGPDGGRTVGDLDVTLSFTGGGGIATATVFSWSPKGDGTFQFALLNPQPNTAFVQSNKTQPTPFPGTSGAYGQNQYTDSLQFVEGAIDITALLGNGIGTPCRALPFTTIFIKTKSSAATTAELKDFIAPFHVDICTDAVPPTITATGTPPNGALGCNPSSAAINGALGSATATDACGAPSVTSSDGTVQSSGCLRSQTRTFTATDECGNTAGTSRTATWTVDVTAPTITANGTPSNGVLGCNPSTAAINAALGTASATDACGTPTVSTPSDGPIQSNGCLRSQTRTWTATDACGNTATTSRTATWTFDITPPTITANGNNTPLGCNPSTAAIDGALGSASATDACGGATVGAPSNGSVQSSGCSRTQTRTFTATDACGNTSTTSRTVTWTFDITPPTIIVSDPTSLTLCNPTSAAIDAALGSATATDACGGATVTNVSTSGITGDCVKSQTRTFTATDACGNTATTSRTVQFASDNTAPSITATGTPPNGVLGCNPSTAAIEAALGTASATDNCGTPSVTPSTGSIISSGCLRTQVRTFTATDVCGNTATTSRTVTWTQDVTAPTITATGGTLTLGCNPSTAAINGALGSASATDACGGATVGTPVDGAVQSSGCSRSQTRTFTATDACGNTATTSRTATWTADLTPPTITCSDDKTQACGTTPSFDEPTVSDNCSGTPGVTHTDSQDGLTRTWTATDGCGNTATCDQTVTISPCGGHIFPTATTCCSFRNGSAQELPNICLTLKGNGPKNVSNATPGVFFYYTKLTALTADFCVTVTQSKSCGTDLALFTLQQGQIVLWEPDCDKVQGTTSTVSADGSTATICVTGATIGQEYVISVKYDTKSIVGTHSGGGDCEYTFGATIVGGAAVPGSGGSITATSSTDCNSEVSAGSCPNTVTVAARTPEQNAMAKDPTVRAYPNPYGSEVNFQFVSPISGQASLEVYDMVGRRLSIVFSGQVDANVARTATYRVPASLRVPMFYRLTVGGKTVVGKVLPGDRHNEPQP